MIHVRGLDHVALTVANREEVGSFYVEHWGLQRFDDEGASETTFLRTRSVGHHALSLHDGNTAALHHLAFEVAVVEDLFRAVEDAFALGQVVEQDAGEPAEPGHKASVRLRDPDGNVVELLWGPEHIEGEIPAATTPNKLGHVVLRSPHVEEMERFYRGLGFRVSDRTARGMSFLRCNTDHHTLALLASQQSSVQHVAYDVQYMDSVMQALSRLRSAGFPCIWGPGRHGPGNNIFTYYVDPAGTIIENYAELEQVGEPDVDIEERYWGPEWSGDLWGVAGPPPQEFRG